MAMAAFKSTSRRATTTTSAATSDKETSTKQHALPRKTVPSRRSRSVSAVSRSHLVDTCSTTRTAAEGTATGSTDFLIKRDNPLYWSNVSPPDKEVGEVVVDKEESKSAPTKPNVDGDSRRGRSVSRKADAGKNVSGIGRSLSRGPVSRGRSVSRPPGSRGHFVNSEVVLSFFLYESFILFYFQFMDSKEGLVINSGRLFFLLIRFKNPEGF
jgi:hypothetical protein